MATYMGRLLTAFSAAFEFNSATLSGAIDIIVVEDERGLRRCSPFHVRFGKLQLLKSRGIPVSVELNGRSTKLRLFLGPAGEAYCYNPPRQRAEHAGDSTKGHGCKRDFDASGDAQKDCRSSRSALGGSDDAINDEEQPTDVQLTPGTISTSSHLAPTSAQLTKVASAPIPEDYVQVHTGALIAPRVESASSPLVIVPSLDVCGYVSDSEVEVSRNERDGTAAVVDEPRSPPVSSVERRYLKGFGRSHSLRDKKGTTPTTPSHSLARPSPLLESASEPAILSEGVPNAKTTLDDLLESEKCQSMLDSAKCHYIGVNANGLGTKDERSQYNLKHFHAGRGAVKGSDSSTSSAVARDSDDEVMMASHPDSISLPTEDAQLDLRSVDGCDDDFMERFASCSNENGMECSYVPSCSPTEPKELMKAVSDALQPVSNSSSRLSPSVSDYTDSEREFMNQREKCMNLVNDEDRPVGTDERRLSLTLSMSLCGSALTQAMSEEQISKTFDLHRVGLTDFEANPSLLYNPDLLVCIGDRLVEFRVAAPYVMALLAYDVHLDLDLLSTMMHLPSVSATLRCQGKDDDKQNADATSGENDDQSSRRTFGNWFSWNRGKVVVGEPLLCEEDLKAFEGSEATAAETSPNSISDDRGDKDLQKPSESLDIEGKSSRDASNKYDVREAHKNLESATREVKFGVSRPVKDGKEENLETNHSSAEFLSSASQTALEEAEKLQQELDLMFDLESDYLSQVPTAEQLAELDLQPGPNTMRFTVESSLAEVSCRIFLWGPDSKIVISDVDGTITRSDVLGHLLPAVGRDWSHVGVAGLYTEIAKHGYKFMYLTARPIGQASQTRGFLRNVIQGGAHLPNGPVLMSPNRLVESFTREVIRRKPQEFKIGALREVRSLFPPDHNPFHAGFGNRETDVISYRAVGLIPQRIFVVNTQTELEVMNVRYESTASYSSLRELVNSVFPDIHGKVGRELVRNLTESAAFNSWNYWKPSLPDIDMELLLREGKI